MLRNRQGKRTHRPKKRDSLLRKAGFAVLIATALAAACSEAPKPAPPPAASRPAPEKLPAKEAADKPAAPEYSYVAAGRRDPFMPLIIREEKKASKANLPPLQRHAIDEFKLTGIVWGGFGYNAMLEGPDGKGYFIKTGTLIGPNQGVVQKITKDGMFIVERYKTYAGEAKSKEIVIELRKKREGM